MAFSLAGILAVALEFFRPWLWLIAAVAAVELVLLILALRRGRPARQLAAVRGPALLIGVIALIAAALMLPGITSAGFSDLYGLLDWAALLGVSVGVGVAAALLSLPPMMLLRG